jgi:hypothetical protein
LLRHPLSVQPDKCACGGDDGDKVAPEKSAGRFSLNQAIEYNVVFYSVSRGLTGVDIGNLTLFQTSHQDPRQTLWIKDSVMCPARRRRLIALFGLTPVGNLTTLRLLDDSPFS